MALDGNVGCMVNGAGLAMATWIWSNKRVETGYQMGGRLMPRVKAFRLIQKTKVSDFG